MPQDIIIRVRVDGDELTVLDTANTKLDDLGASAAKAGGSGGFGALTQGAADMVQGIRGSIGIMQTAVQMFGDVQKGGEAVQHATQALDTMSHGQAPAYMNALRTATHGYVDDATLAHDAALGLSTGIASNAAEMAKIIGIGASVGEVFMNDAAQGVQTFETALEHVGQTRPLATLGYDISAVKDEFNSLVKQGMDKADAWRKTLLDLAPAFDDTGNAWDKLMVRSTNSMNDFKNNAATGFNGIAGTIDLLNSKKVTVDVVFNAVKNEDFSWITRIVGDVVGAGASAGADLGASLRGGGSPTYAINGAGATLWGGNNTGFGGDMGFGPDGTFYTGGTSDSGGGGGGGPPTSIRGMQEAGMLTRDPNAGRTAGEASARSSAAGGYNVSDNTPQSDKMVLAADAARSMQSALDASATKTAQMDSDMQGTYKSFEKISNAKSLAQAFPSSPDYNPIYGEIGTIGQDAAIRRKQLEAQLQKEVGTYQQDGTGYGGGGGGSSKDLTKMSTELQTATARHADLAYAISHTKHETEMQRLEFERTGEAIGTLNGKLAALHQQGGGGGKVYTKTDMQRDLGTFDDSAKREQDNYDIATGKSTEASVKFRDIQGEIRKSAQDGKISFAEESNELIALGNAAATSKTSLADLVGLEATLTGAGGSGPAHRQGRARDADGNVVTDAGKALPGGAGTVPTPKTADGKGAESVYDPFIQGAKKVQTENTAIGTTLMAIPAVAGIAAVMTAAGISPMNVAIQGTMGFLDQLKAKFGSIQGSYTATITVTNAGGSGGGAGTQDGGHP